MPAFSPSILSSARTRSRWDILVGRFLGFAVLGGLLVGGLHVLLQRLDLILQRLDRRGPWTRARHHRRRHHPDCRRRPSP